MSKNEDASSSSEDEAAVAALREACDDHFLPNTLFSTKDTPTATEDVQPENVEKTKPSLRITERTDNFESFGVSQSFKDYIAKKLRDKLERSIEVDDEENIEEGCPKKKRKKKIGKRIISESGIKLLSSSHETIVDVECAEKEIKATNTRLQKSKESEVENVEKCQSVAVDPEWIISKAETKAWTERQRNVFKYKKGCNGVLIEQQ